jgi:hypothetical protein
MNDLNDQNFLIYAIKAYDKPNSITSEFENDIKKIKYIKRLLRKYKATGVLKERLILNHLIVLGNVFGPVAITRMLFFRIEPEFHGILKTFLLFLNLMPKIVQNIDGKNILSSNIAIDMKVADILRNL